MRKYLTFAGIALGLAAISCCSQDSRKYTPDQSAPCQSVNYTREELTNQKVFLDVFCGNPPVGLTNAECREFFQWCKEERSRLEQESQEK
jgi:hypothetical protein